ncbi:MAG TPA: hypothetical protein PLV56_00035 [Synergistales bacterium]|nr:hypothetical protein [Synergistales bacterium]
MSRDIVRDVLITIGNKSYSIETGLEEDVLNRILFHIEEAMSGVDATADQEKALLIACLDLSYRFDVALQEINHKAQGHIPG